MAEHPLNLPVESLDTVGHKAHKAEVLPLFRIECGALIQIWVVQYINATQRFRARSLLLLHAKRLWIACLNSMLRERRFVSDPITQFKLSLRRDRSLADANCSAIDSYQKGFFRVLRGTNQAVGLLTMKWFKRT